MAGQPITINEEYLANLCAQVAERAAKAAAETAATTAFAEGFQAGQSSSPAPAPAPATRSGGKASGKTTRTKLKATDNYELDQERMISVDTRDPRAMGEGPCGTDHTPKETGNQWARWTDCSRCCLRMEYIPYTHAPAQSTRTENPKDIRDALKELWEAGIWDDMEAKQMQAKIKEITARKALKYQNRGRPILGAKAKGKGKPARYNMDQIDETPETEEGMNEYNPDTDWSAVQAAELPDPAHA
jgi:hypothetical protein